MSVVLDFAKDELADEDMLRNVFERQRIIEDGTEGMAMLLYRLRSTWIGGMTLPWGLLTEGQRAGYRAEVNALIKKAKGEN